MARPEEITTELKKLIEICDKLVKWTDGEQVSARMIRDDMTAMLNKKLSLQKEMDEIVAHNDRLRLQAAGVIDEAKREAQKMIDAARADRVEASRDRELAKQLLSDAESKKYLSKKEKAAA